MHACMHAHMITCRNAYMHTCIDTLECMQMNAYALVYAFHKYIGIGISMGTAISCLYDMHLGVSCAMYAARLSTHVHHSP